MPSPVDPGTARKVWRTLEPYHRMIYFVPEAAEEYDRLGIHGRHGYFAIGEAGCARVRELVRPWSKAMAQTL